MSETLIHFNKMSKVEYSAYLDTLSVDQLIEEAKRRGII
jgi:hypothetical protein